MPDPKKTLNNELFELLKQFYIDVTATNEAGEPVTDPASMANFSFPVKDRHGHVKNNVVVDLLDPGTLTITLDQSSDSAVTRELDRIIKKLKNWAAGHDLEFDAEQLGQKRTRRDPGDRRATSDPDSAKPVLESVFSPLTGTVKTSTQRLPNARLIIQHTDPVNEDQRGARTRRILRIYVVNPRGERFLLPTTSLRGARAHARHVDQGGNPYDQLGQAISGCADEAQQLGKFIRRTRRGYDDQQAQAIIAAAQWRLAEVRQLLQRLSTSRGYAKYRDQIDYQPVVKNFNDAKNPFVQNHYDERLDDCLPYAWRAYQMNQMPEMQEFQNWTEELVTEAGVTVDPKVAAVEKMITGNKPPKPQGIQVGKTPKGTVAITVPKDDPEAGKQAAKFFGSGGAAKLPPGTTVSVTEDVPTRTIQITNKRTGKSKELAIPSNVDDARLMDFVADISKRYGNQVDIRWTENGEPVQETIGGDKSDDFIGDIQHRPRTPVTEDSLELAALLRLSGM